MTKRQQLDELATNNEVEIIVADGFDAALIGTADFFCFEERVSKTHALYDAAKCIQCLMDNDGMDETEAQEFFDYNVAGAVIRGGPIFINVLHAQTDQDSA
jgi:hypothetical protein